MRHYLIQSSLPFAGCTWAGAGVWPEFAGFLMLSFLSVNKGDCAASVRVFAGEHYIASHFLHGEVANVAEGATTRRAARQLGTAARADQMPALALQDRGQDIVEAHGTLEQRSEISRHGGRDVHEGGYSRHRTTGTASSAPFVVCAHVTVTRTLIPSISDRLPITVCSITTL